MSISRYYSKQLDFVLTEVVGELNDHNLIEHIHNLNKLSTSKKMLELADCRKISTIERATVTGVRENAKQEIDRPESLLAIVVPEDAPLIYGMARTYQMFSENNRKECQIFKDFDEALLWLAGGKSSFADEIKLFLEREVSKKRLC